MAHRQSNLRAHGRPMCVWHPSRLRGYDLGQNNANRLTHDGTAPDLFAASRAAILSWAWTEYGRPAYWFAMQPTMTTADWLRRAADAWSEVDATANSEARKAKVAIAEGCERLAKHAAFLAQGDPYPPAGWLGEMVRSVDNLYPSFGLRTRHLHAALSRKLRARMGGKRMRDERLTP